MEYVLAGLINDFMKSSLNSINLLESTSTNQVFLIWNFGEDYHLKPSKMLHAKGRNLQMHKPNRVWLRRTAPRKTKTAVKE